MKRLAIISTHPIQYNAPWFKLLAESGVYLKVFYTQGRPSDMGNFDPGFKKVIKWDIPLLEGYEYTFVENVSKKPGTGQFRSVINPSLNQEVGDWKPDAILVMGWNFSSHLKLMRKFHGAVPILFRGDSTLLDEGPGLKRPLRRIFLKWVYRFVDKALYVGANNKAYFMAHGLKESQLVFTPHAIDNSRFFDQGDKYQAESEEWRSKLGFKPEDIVIEFVGKLEAKKNPGILLQVAERTVDPRIKFLFVGNGELEADLREKARTIANVQFLDFQNQRVMPVVYRMANMLILPSQGPGETWGLALNEAMACSLPVIASDRVGGAVDLIKPGRNGFIFASGNPDDLQQKLTEMINNCSLTEMGKQSVEIIGSWSFEHIVNAVRKSVNVI